MGTTLVIGKRQMAAGGGVIRVNPDGSITADPVAGKQFVIGGDTDTANYGDLRVLHTSDLTETSDSVRAGIHVIRYAERTTGGSYTGTFIGIDGTAAVKRTTTTDFTTGAVSGLWGAGVWDANASADNVFGVAAELWVYPNADGPGSEVVTNAVFFRGSGETTIQSNKVTNLYGLYLERMTRGATTNIGAYIAGGSTYAIYSAQDANLFGGKVLIGTSGSNANSTLGLTIDQGTNDDQALCLRSSTDVTTGLTSITGQATSTNDYFTISKLIGAEGGVWMKAMGESTVATPMYFNSWGGAPPTTDTSASLAAMNFFCGQHTGSNADADMAADSNAVAFGEIDSNGAALTRLILKADDGELHLGNTTLVALDDEDDVQLVRAMQKTGADGGVRLTALDNPFYDYDKLHELGLAGEKDAEGFFLFPLQSRLHAHEGAIWQLLLDLMDVAAALPAEAKAQLNPRLRGRLALMGGVT